MKHIILIARLGYCGFDEIDTVFLTKGEEKQIENGVLDASELIEESLDLGGGDTYFEIEPTKKNIDLFKELIIKLERNNR